MPINTDLLVSAPVLQNYLVDKDTGFPLANGIVTLRKDLPGRDSFKNWYYQTGGPSPGQYQWIALDNPMHLSSVGTIQDPNGNDVLPFYYPYDEDDPNTREAYYITVYSADENGDPAILQFTRENFPFAPSNSSPEVQSPTLRNYIINNVYWRNIGSKSLVDDLDIVVAPSQHDGYTNGDIRFVKDAVGDNDSIAFPQMTQSLENDNITPEYYLNFKCTGSGGTPATIKYIQYPVSLHLQTLANVRCSIVFNGQSVGGTAANDYVTLCWYTYAGSGITPQPTIVTIGQVRLTSNFTRSVIPAVTPPVPPLLSQGGDDALFLLVVYPQSDPAPTFEINHTKPQIYLSSEVPDNDFDTYDQIAAICNSPRTGDFRTSLNSFSPFGWVPANDGSIGSPTSSATTRSNADTWPLYKLIWENVSDTFAPVNGAPGNRGASAYDDFKNDVMGNKPLSLTKALGRVLMGLPTSSTFTYDHLTQLLTIPDATLYYFGSPVTLSNSGGALPPAFTAGTVYYVIPVSATTIQIADSYANAIARAPVAAGASDGTGTQTISFALGGYFGESKHVQSEVELFPHNHPGSLGRNSPMSGGGIGCEQGVTPGSTFGQQLLISTQGGTGVSHIPTPFNIVQPSTYYNVFLKL